MQKKTKLKISATFYWKPIQIKFHKSFPIPIFIVALYVQRSFHNKLENAEMNEQKLKCLLLLCFEEWK